VEVAAGDWLVVMDDKLVKFGDTEFRDKFEAIAPHNSHHGLPKRKPRREVARVKRQPDGSKAPTLATMILDILRQRKAAASKQLFDLVSQAGRRTTEGTVYQVCYQMKKRGQVTYDEGSGTYRLAKGKPQ